MVSRETNLINHYPSPEFIAGYISSCGTFFEIRSTKGDYFGFKIKAPKNNSELLKIIGTRLKIKSPVRIYNEKDIAYAILQTRSKKELLQYIIPFLDDRLFGTKLIQYENWKSKILKTS